VIGINGFVSDKTVNELEQAFNWAAWVWEETRGDYYSYEYQEAQKRYDAAVAQWNRECRGEA
jgi:hypothetical protein